MRKIRAPHSGLVFVSGSLNDRCVSPDRHQRNQREPRFRFERITEGGSAAGIALEAKRFDCDRAPSNTGIHAEPGLCLERVHLCFIRWSHFLKSGWVSISEGGDAVSAALGWAVCTFIRSPGLGKCLRRGHVLAPRKSEGIDLLQRAAPPRSAHPARRRSCRRRSGGKGPRIRAH